MDLDGCIDSTQPKARVENGTLIIKAKKKEGSVGLWGSLGKLVDRKGDPKVKARREESIKEKLKQEQEVRLVSMTTKRVWEWRARHGVCISSAHLAACRHSFNANENDASNDKPRSCKAVAVSCSLDFDFFEAPLCCLGSVCCLGGGVPSWAFSSHSRNVVGLLVVLCRVQSHGAEVHQQQTGAVACFHHVHT